MAMPELLRSTPFSINRATHNVGAHCRSLEAPLMSVRHWQSVLLTMVVACGLGGCSGNYTFNDAAYRPLGDPQAINRGK
jgi:hypothetical protein